MPKLFKSHHHSHRIALFTCIVGFFVWAILLTKKFYAFQYYDGDMALYANMMWNLSQGHVVSSLFGINFLANHTQFIAFLIAPLYAVFSSPLLLIYLKIAALFTGAYIFYHIAWHYLHKTSLAFYIMLCFLFHPANLFMLPHEFHFEPLAIPFLFASFYFFVKSQWRWFMVMCVLVCLIKENLPAIVFMYGFLGIIKTKKVFSRWSIGPWLLGGIALWLCLFVLPPIFRADLPNQGQMYFALYDDVIPQEGGVVNKAASLLTHMWDRLTMPKFWHYGLDLFGAPGLAAIFAPHIWGVALPIMLQNILSNQSQQHTIFFHYANTILPFIFCAAVVTLGKVTLRWRYFLILGIIVLTFFHFSNYKSMLYQRSFLNHRPTFAGVAAYVLSHVGKEEPIASSLTLLDHLTSRKIIYSMLDVWRGRKPFTNDNDFHLPDTVKSIVMDFRAPYYKVETFSGQADLNRLKFLYNTDWAADVLLDDVALIRKGSQGLRFLDIKEGVNEPTSTRWSLPQGLSLIDHRYQLTKEADFVILDAYFTWYAHQNINHDFDMALWLESDTGKKVYQKQRGLAYDLWPTSLWKAGQLTDERYRYVLPQLSPGEYHIYILLSERQTQHKASGEFLIMTSEKSEKFRLGSIVINESERHD